jgi:hypothetical protein
MLLLLLLERRCCCDVVNASTENTAIAAVATSATVYIDTGILEDEGFIVSCGFVVMLQLVTSSIQTMLLIRTEIVTMRRILTPDGRKIMNNTTSLIQWTQRHQYLYSKINDTSYSSRNDYTLYNARLIKDASYSSGGCVIPISAISTSKYNSSIDSDGLLLYHRYEPYAPIYVLSMWLQSSQQSSSWHFEY